MGTPTKIELPTSLKVQVQERSRAGRKERRGKVKAEAIATTARNDPSPHLRSERWPLSKLKGAKRRSRRTSPAQLERVVRSVSRLGFLKPVLIDSQGTIIDGHILVEAARQMGLDDIACSIIDHLSEDELRMARIALNRIAETGEWDLDELAIELEELDLVGLDLDLSGFDAAQLDVILEDPETSTSSEPDPAPPVHPVTRPGDMWLLGDHKLYCGDCREPKSYEALLTGTPIDCVFSDPPYNIKIDGVVSGLGKVKHGDFTMGCSEMTDEEFRSFLVDYLRLAKTHCAEGAVIFACMDWRQIDLLLIAGREAGLHRINKIIWFKGSGGMGGLYRSSYEEIAVFCTQTSPATNNVKLGAGGRDRMNVWEYAGANRKGSSAGKALGDHPTPKPVELVVDALHDVTQRGDIVFDPFMGSGTTIIACEKTKRRGRGTEIDPAYVDVTIRRWEKETGKDATLSGTGLTFAQMAVERAKPEAAE